MAGNRGMTVFVLLLSCWHEAKLQPINMTSGTVTGGLSLRQKTLTSLGPNRRHSFSLGSFPTCPIIIYFWGRTEWSALNSFLSLKPL